MEQISAENSFRSVEFAENPEPRVPCVLILDTSTSMHGPRIDELNAGLKAYRDELLADSLAAKRVEVAIVTFGGRVTRLVDFVSAANFDPPTLQVIGGTPMGEAIGVALDMIDERKASYRENGIAYYRPWAFLDHRRRAERPLEAGRLASSRRRGEEVVLLFRRGRRRRQHEDSRGNLACASRCGCRA